MKRIFSVMHYMNERYILASQLLSCQLPRSEEVYSGKEKDIGIDRFHLQRYVAESIICLLILFINPHESLKAVFADLMKNHWLVEARRDLWRSFWPSASAKSKTNIEQVAQDYSCPGLFMKMTLIRYMEGKSPMLKQFYSVTECHCHTADKGFKEPKQKS